MPAKKAHPYDGQVVRALWRPGELSPLPVGAPYTRCVGFWQLGGHARRCRSRATILREGFALCETDARRATSEVFVDVR